MEYLVAKSIHVSAVIASYALFFLRGVWMIRDSTRLNRRWVKVIPHVIDTVLLASAIWLALLLRQYPFVHDWLTAKVVALLAYIGLGMIAITHGKTKQKRIAAWALAQLVFLYIVAVARTHHPVPFAAWQPGG